MDDSSLLLAEAAVIRGEDAAGLVIGCVLAVARTTAGVGAPAGRATRIWLQVSAPRRRAASATWSTSGPRCRRCHRDTSCARPTPTAGWRPAAAGVGSRGVVRPAGRAAGAVGDRRRDRSGGRLVVPLRPADNSRGRGRRLHRCSRIADVDSRGSATAAWARQLWDRGVPLFYSHAEDNVASQRVAEGLGLRLLGRLWFVTRAEPEA